MDFYLINFGFLSDYGNILLFVKSYLGICCPFLKREYFVQGSKVGILIEADEEKLIDFFSCFPSLNLTPSSIS
jgi:hypothetical protein